VLLLVQGDGIGDAFCLLAFVLKTGPAAVRVWQRIIHENAKMSLKWNAGDTTITKITEITYPAFSDLIPAATPALSQSCE
jgi:hypothetical protein